MQTDLEEYINEYNKRLIEHYSSYSLDELKDQLAAAHEKYGAAVRNYQRHYLNSEKVMIENASVRIENLKFVINYRESGEQS